MVTDVKELCVPVESYCIPNFDSPSVFARILDKDKGGHFSVTPSIPFSSKQNYLPSSNVSSLVLRMVRIVLNTGLQVIQTKYLNDMGVVSVTGECNLNGLLVHRNSTYSSDYLPRPRRDKANPEAMKPLLPWLVRRVECIRGTLPLVMQCAPAFNYARSTHITSIVDDESVPLDPDTPPQKKALFESDSLALDLRYVIEVADGVESGVSLPEVVLEFLDLSHKGHKGLAIQSRLTLEEGQCVTFVLRTPPTELKVTTDKDETQTKPTTSMRSGLDKLLHLGRSIDDPFLTKELLALLLHVGRFLSLLFLHSDFGSGYEQVLVRVGQSEYV